VTEGKVAVDEDKSTPVFSPYAGRVMKLMVRRDNVTRTAAVLIEAADNRTGAE